jgi:Ras-related GTP-binding protein C/D
MDIILMGISKSGKSSIQKVVFEKMFPHETSSIPPTLTIESFEVKIIEYCQLNLYEFPFSFKFNKMTSEEENYFNNSTMIIYVLDCQNLDDKSTEFEYFENDIIPIIKKHPKISLSIFLHKVDNVNFYQNDKSKQKGEILLRLKNIIKKNNLNLFFSHYITSIYDYSLFEAFSKIFQKIMPQNSVISTLLDDLSNYSRLEKVYLFDVFNKIYLAVDSFPMETQTYEICSDMIDVMLDTSGIYGEENNYDSYFDENSACIIKINDIDKKNENSILYLRFINFNLALICLLREKNFEKTHLLDYNIKLFRNAVKNILNN